MTFEASEDLQNPVNMGYVVENAVLVTALEKQLETLSSNVDVQYKAKLKKFDVPQNVSQQNKDSLWVKVELENGQILSSRLIVRMLYQNSLGILLCLPRHAFLFLFIWNIRV